MKTHLVGLVLLSILIFFPASVYGDLLLQISGTPGSGVTTTWTFSGTATVTDDGATEFVIDDDDPDIGYGWYDIGPDFYLGTDSNLDFTTSSASFTEDGTLYQILGVGPDNSQLTSSFGFAIDTSPPGTGLFYAFDVGDTLAFTGTATLNTDINQFTTGTYTVEDWRTGPTINQHDLAATITVSAVPEPSALALLGLAGFGLLVCRRRAN